MDTKTTRPIASLVLSGLLLAATPAWARGSPALQSKRSRDVLRFTATAYCKGNVTAAGTTPYDGIVAADPDLLPVGSAIGVRDFSGGEERFYTVMDTGRKIQGRRIDVYHENCREARKFGRRPVEVRIVSR
jgi:3D (Asp-Asp-Asp) domain-containing protein